MSKNDTSYRRLINRLLKIFFMLQCTIAISGCDLSPDYTLPTISMADFIKNDKKTPLLAVAPITTQKEVAPIADGRWKRFDPYTKHQAIAWWRMFDDSTLNALMEQALKNNPSLREAIERVKAARGFADESGAPLLPSVSVGFGPERLQQSSAAINANLPPSARIRTKPYTLYTARGTISYELDVFGKNRATARAASHDAQAQMYDYLAARTALEAEIVQTYFRLISQREEERLVNEDLAAFDESLTLMRERFRIGDVDRVALAALEQNFALAQSNAATAANARAVTEHALAELMGIVPSALSLKTHALTQPPPLVPAGLPSSLLERRPDIKSAANKIAAANERIGVARSGYFPDISLSASGGTAASVIEDLFKWSSRTWALGPLAGTILTQPIFEGGRLAAVRAQADANYHAAVARYKASVLKAFREVEDQLSYVQQSAIASQAAMHAERAARQAFTVIGARYHVGAVSKPEYLTSKREWLQAERNKIQATGQYYIATVQMVKALGGSWQAIPPPETLY